MADATANVIVNAQVSGLNFFQQFVDLMHKVNEFTGAGFTKAEQGANKVTSALSRTNKEAQQLDKTSSSLNNGLTTLGNSLDAVSGFLTKIAVAFGAVGGIMAVLLADTIQQAASFDALYRSLVFVSGGVDAAKKKLEELRELAKLPGLGFREAIEGQVRLQATLKLTEATVTKALNAFGRAIAVSGGGKEQLQAVTYQLSQMASKGRLAADDLKPLLNNVLNLRAAFKLAFGTDNTEEINNLGLPPEEFISKVSDALLELTKDATNLAGAANSMENFADAIDQLKIAIGSAVLDEVGAGINAIADGITYLRTTFEGLSPTARKAIFAVVAAVAGLSAIIGVAAGIAAAITAAIAGFIGLVAIVGSVKATLGLILIPFAAVIAITGGVVVAIGALIAAIVLLKKVYDRNVGGIQQAISSAIFKVQESLKNLRLQLEYVYQTLLPKFQAAVLAIIGKIEEFWVRNHEAIRNTVERVWNAIVKIISTAITVVSNAIELVLNLMTGDTAKALLNAQTLWYYFVNAVIKAVQMLVDIHVWAVTNIIRLLIGLGIKLVQLGIYLAKEFIRGFINYIATTGSVNVLGYISSLIAKVFNKGKEWYDAGKANAESYNAGLQNFLNNQPLQASAEGELGQSITNPIPSPTKTGGGGGAGQSPTDEASKAREKSSRAERSRAIEAETAAVERAYNRRTIAAVDYYDQLADLSSRQTDIEIEEQQQAIARAQSALARAKSQNDKDRAQADIINAETTIADLQAKRQQAMLEFNEKYRDFQKQLSDSFNQQLERVFELTGEFDKLGATRIANTFNEKIQDVSTELEATNKKLDNLVASGVDEAALQFLRSRQAVIKGYLENLKFERDVQLIIERQKEIESNLEKANVAASSGSVTEAERSKAILEALTKTLTDLKAERVKLQGLGADTTGISAKINETEQKRVNEQQLVFEREVNAELEERDRLLAQLEVLQKSTNADEASIATRREAIYKNTAEIIEGAVIPQMEAFLATLTTGSAQAEQLRKAIEALKKETALDKAPDAARITERALKPTRDNIDRLTQERERRLSAIDQDQELSGFERAEARKKVIEETNALIQEQIDKFAVLIEAQKQLGEDGTVLNAEAIKALREEWNGMTDALKQSNSEVLDYSKSLKQVAKDALGSGLVDFFDSLVSGTKSLKDAALDFANSFIRAIQQVIVQMLVMKALTAIFNAISPGLGGSLFGRASGGSVAGARTGGWLQRLTGGGEVLANPVGKLVGQGSPTSDSMMAFFNSVGKFVKVGNAEYVLDGQTTANLGTSFLDKVLASKGRILEPILGRADGGSVDGAVADRASAISPRANEAALEAAGGDTNVNINVGLSPTEMMKRALQHPDGVMAIVDAIGNNSTKIKTRLEIA